MEKIDDGDDDMMSRSVIVVKETGNSILCTLSKHISIDILSKHISIDILSKHISIDILSKHISINLLSKHISIDIMSIIIIIIIIITPLIFLSLRLGTIINPSGIQDLGILGYKIQASDFELYVDSI